MDIIESIDNLQVQDPPGEDFCSTDLDWVKLRSAERCDDVALIPYDRVDAFIIGECSNVECPTRFHIERGRKRPVGSLKEYKNDEYLEYKRDIETHVTSDFRKNSKKKYQEIILFYISEICIIFHWGVNRHVCEIADMYWCSFGPENYGEGGGTLPSRRYRLNTRSRAARPQSMRGCQCHFVVKRLYARPSLALLIYNCRRHVNKAGAVCHGPLDKDAIGPGAKQIPYVSSDIQQQTMSMIYLGIPEENVLAKHIEGIQRYCGSDPKVQTVASQYVQKLGMIIKRSTHELDLDDQVSIRLWVERNKKSIFFYRDTSDDDPFILGIQTEWQLQQMIRFGHHNIIAVDSTFGIKRLKYPLCTLLVFDSRQHALPVAWIITRSIAKPDVAIWMKALLGRVHSVEPGWKANGFLIDDAAAEINSIRETFSCPVLFSLWRVRRSWLRHIVKKCTNIEVQREIFRRLGQIVYGIWGGKDLAVSFEELLLDFVDQTSFMQYFKDSWLPKIEMWLKLMKTLPLASQEASGAIEAYHVKLKTKLYEDSQLDSLQRVDWLVHKLMTDMHSSYWLDHYADESDLFPTVKEDYLASTSWHRALQIPDASVSFDKDYQLFAKVVSQKDSTLSRIVWNPGSEFAHCDCEWSLQGNLCKHVVKVNMICGNMPCYQSSLSFQSLKTILMDLWKKPMDDSVALDISTALTFQVLDQVQKLVELKDSKDIGLVVKNMPVKWGAKRARKSSGRQSPVLELPGTSKSNAARISRKRKKRLYHR